MITMKTKLLYLFMSVLTLGIVSSCSKDDDGDGDGGQDNSLLIGKWYYYQEGMVIGGTEHLETAFDGCDGNYTHIVLNSNGSLEEYWYYDMGNGCETYSETGSWERSGNNFTLFYDGELYMQGQIMHLDEATLKISYVENQITYIVVFKRTISGGNNDDVTAFAGTWEGTYTGDDNGIFSVNISNSGQISGNGYSTNWGESFTLTGTVNSDGSFNAGNTSLGATFTGTIIGNNLTGNWQNSTTGESGTFVGQKTN
jgi:hypothetical protein